MVVDSFTPLITGTTSSAEATLSTVADSAAAEAVRGRSGALLASITTDASGQYQFSGLAAGTYSVCQPEQPAGTVNGQTLAGGIVAVNGSSGTPGTGSNPSATSSRIAGIVLNFSAETINLHINCALVEI